MIIILFLEGEQLAETKNKFSNLFDKYLTQKRKVLINKRTITNNITKIKKQVI